MGTFVCHTHELVAGQRRRQEASLMTCSHRGLWSGVADDLCCKCCVYLYI